VEIPSVEMIAKDTNGLDAALNQEIYDLCSRYAEEAAERAREYKKAFMETGGTEEEWEAHDIKIHVGYESRPRQKGIFPLQCRKLRTGPRPAVKQDTITLI
jgi:hypothetical protein